MSGQTVVDPKGYLTDLQSLTPSAGGDIGLVDDDVSQRRLKETDHRDDDEIFVIHVHGIISECFSCFLLLKKKSVPKLCSSNYLGCPKALM